MRSLDAAFNRWRVPGFVLNSLPKAGTNLVKKALDLIPGVRDSREYVWGAKALALADNGADDAGETVPVGVGWPRPVPVEALAASLDRVGRGQYAVWHVACAPTTAGLLRQRHMRMVVVIRDPRDVVLSLVRYVMKQPGHRLHAALSAMSPEERVLASIRGMPESAGGLLDIAARCDHILAWTRDDTLPVHRITFERLVGAGGGGDAAAQRDTLAALIDFLGLRVSPGQVDAIAGQLFGGTRTFQRGTIGGWREEFTPAHTAAMKDVAGDLLIDLGYAHDYDW